MSYRAAVVLIEQGRLALIERRRQGLHYFTFPGGHVDPGERPEAAAVRESWEELGLHVVIRRLLAKIWWRDQPQYYYLAESTGGIFGSGTAEEMASPQPDSGTYRPVWRKLADLPRLPVKPRLMAELALRSEEQGWPTEILEVTDDEAD
jgi:8-oxo-dGTP pyrophosphatase MutT (NUDIX family)